METFTYTAPAYWACYLFNDDPSGMEDSEIAACDAWIDHVGLGGPTGTSDESEFIIWHDARQFSPLAADCLEYTFLK